MGSRGLKVSDLGNYLPANVTEIVSRDAKWINPCAKEYSLSREIKLTEYLSEYEKYGKAAPLKRNITIIESVGHGGVLDAPVAVEDQSRGRALPADGHVQGVQGKLGVDALGKGIPYNFLGAQVFDNGEIQPAFPGGDVGVPFPPK